MQKIPSNVKELRKGKWRRLRALVIKEFFQVIRDPSSLLISVVLPSILLFLYGFAVSLDLDHLRMGLVLEDTSPDAQSFAKSMTNSRYFEVTIARDRREMTDLITRGAIRGFVVIPSYFSQFRNNRARIAPIQVIADGSEPNTANFVQNYMQGVYSNWLAQEAVSYRLQGLPKVNAQPRFWYNEELKSRFFLLPGSFAIIMTLVGTLLTALVVSREWERGTMEALMSTPVGSLELVLGKLIPYFFLGMISMALCVILSMVFYDLPLRGSWLLLILVSAIFLVCALGLGLMISTAFRVQIIAAQIAITVGFLPSYMLSGFIFEIASMPLWIQGITYLIPARYLVQSLQTLFLVGNVWYLILWNLVPMILISFVIYALTARNMVKRLD